MNAYARIVTENLVEAMRFFGRARENAEVREYPGASVIYCGLNYAAFNAVVMGATVDDGASGLQRRIDEPAGHFEARKLRWSCWYCDDLIGKPLLRQARSLLEKHGLTELTQAPGMMAEQISPPHRLLPAIEIKPVCDEATRLAFANLTSIAFDVPWNICREVYGAERAWRGSFQGYVGYVNGDAVSTTSIVVAGGVAGVYSVGTIPGRRRHGYAEALMRGALELVRRRTGIERTVLQSTRSGYSMYRRMGYGQVTNFTVYITD